MKHLIQFLKVSVTGALLFWFPSILLHMIRGDKFSGIDIIILTILLPVTSCTFLSVTVVRFKGFHHKFSPLFTLFGIWFFGPICMVIESTFLGKGLLESEGWYLAGVGTLLFPIFTFLMSTYDGMLGAVLFTTLGLVMMQTLFAFSPKEVARPE
jgi:hypothetical protein